MAISLSHAFSVASRKTCTVSIIEIWIFFPPKRMCKCVQRLRTALNLLSFSSYKALGIRVFLRHPIKPREGKNGNNSTTQKKVQEPDTQTFVWLGESIFPSLARQYDSQVIHGWNYIISLYIDWKMWSFYCCYVLGPLARRCVGNNAARGAPTHPPAMLHLLQKLTWWILKCISQTNKAILGG